MHKRAGRLNVIAIALSRVREKEREKTFCMRIVRFLAGWSDGVELLLLRIDFSLTW